MTLTEVGRSTATTYQFRGDPHGWATCTVNDSTGELTIQSDWTEPCGHRWDPRHLGEPSLTKFLARHRSGNFDYLVDKLLARERIERFCPRATVKEMRRRVISARYAGDLTRDVARDLWNELHELMGYDDHNDFWRHLDDTDYGKNFDDIYEDAREVPTIEAVALGTIILPALRDACQREVERMATKESP